MAASIERLVHRVGEGQRPTALVVFSMVLLRCLLGVQGHAVAWNSLNDDLLPPYLPPRHGPRHHHRYLSEEDVLAKDNPFVQLVSGVGWLLRDGEVYVNQSRAVECDETQETGTFDKFINTVSARTAVGHDRQGQLVLAHFDGQTHTRGLSLWDMADFLKQQGVVNAINLDGGGSATLVLNGTLASYPSDHCEPYPMWRCPRQVSTILCVHEPACQPPDCSGHGHCVLGECQCDGALWKGPACDVLDCGPSNCTLHGICTEEGCLCDAGWQSPNCSEACAPGSYGDGCLQKCLCLNGGACDPVHGTCNCSAGYQGTHCEEACPSGWYGPNCQDACSCPNQRPCDRKTGSCNVSAECPPPDDVDRGQCLLKADEKGVLLGFTIKGWFIGVLSVLLLVSAVFNIKHFCCSSPAGRQNFSRRPNSSHYEPLWKSNSFSLAAGENEDYTEDTET
ncbi:N-acetylglucosamine-1-phosphodiester alpha-N-acetylglucosaminidase isoform X2 [Podarcis lilfordi]|uniref:N-acetylglucosamine-1-phosphodiester alpha-N-acetylglucosaminidase isoform X2 n=1 Tax=Podarcis lilfordi TaxID=74358 RepID=A0AA35LAJ0_9SAUR|nr:N-acetylglucosamine-1-phosphodiester alpha-N-acetylglucosaminidase isoform X2 [Podarcis lilfordi]